MTREQFLSQYTGEWSPSDGHWFGLDFGWPLSEGSAALTVGSIPMSFSPGSLP